MKNKEKAENCNPCKSVFKDGAATPTKKSVTEAWTKLISRMESDKAKSSR